MVAGLGTAEEGREVPGVGTVTGTGLVAGGDDVSMGALIAEDETETRKRQRRVERKGEQKGRR